MNIYDVSIAYPEIDLIHGRIVVAQDKKEAKGLVLEQTAGCELPWGSAIIKAIEPYSGPNTTPFHCGAYCSGGARPWVKK